MAPPLLLPSDGPAEALARRLERAWGENTLVGLCAPQERELLASALTGAGPAEADPAGSALSGAGVVVGSGGSAGGRRWCLQPLTHLGASARATGQWLQSIGLNPSGLLLLNPLPLHHVSGLLSLVRHRQWGAELRWLPPELMRQPRALAAAFPLAEGPPAVLSLVPTQLERLLACPEGAAWLRGCALVWIGGGALPVELARRARREEIRLSPCYGATETAAMVTALPPERFLAGWAGCGDALPDVELRLDAQGALLVRTLRISPGHLQGGALRPLGCAGGWWRSGDAAAFAAGGLEILGRLDGAISSGGETVFPEQVEARLLGWARQDGLPLRHLLLVPRPDPLWGERLVALVRPDDGGADADALIERCRRLAQRLPPAQRPLGWLPCPPLAPNGLGKWERARWRDWLRRVWAVRDL